ncbi:hypothetical protein PV08_11411 [Exophiala spinifera]|uniref:Major facilitator superfamily (MFS) profile domain-containing protein n=1 Tax=Exophiala spinifera TaxID=91928 RepID=A0A0D1ZBT1_9EURO|nr:uncharacterized protein PV08_11411 [Exophiala spinifera]KIW10447.1 hypothetical protein PV08_11411 [Exophiala spinifera]
MASPVKPNHTARDRKEEDQVPTVDEKDDVWETEKAHPVETNEQHGEAKWTWKHMVAVVCLCGVYVGKTSPFRLRYQYSGLMLKTGSQLPLYFVGSSLTFIAADLGASSLGWLPSSNTLVPAAVCPLCGYLQDTFGKRNISILGSTLIMTGIILMGTAHTLGQGITGMSISRAGAAIGELTALAGVVELVPVKKRGLYLACVTFFLFPCLPYVLYSQLLSTKSTWKWGLWISLTYNGVCFIGVLIFYFPDSHILRKGSMQPQEIAKRIDYIGMSALLPSKVEALSILGPAPMSCASWSSGFVSIFGFILWEWRGAQHQMIPGELFAGQRVVEIALAIAFLSGMNFNSMISFVPLPFVTVFDPDPVQVGLKGLGYSLSGALGVSVMNACPDALMATTTALTLSVRFLGSSIGYSIYYSVFMQKLKVNLPATVLQLVVAAGLPVGSAPDFVETFLTNSTALPGSIPGGTPGVLEAATMGSRWAYLESLKYVWYTSIPFGILSVIGCCLLGDISKFMSDRVAVGLKQ